MSDNDEQEGALIDDDEGDDDEIECDCPVLDAEDWDGVESDWGDIAFLKTNVRAAIGVPIGYATKRAELRRRAESMGASVAEDAMFLLGPGRFSRPLLLEVEGVEDGAEEVFRPGGVAYSRLYEAPYGEFRKLLEQFAAEAEEEYGRTPEAVYLWYLTCRTCSNERNFETLFVAHYA
jgi:hypothetical protein